MQAGSKRNETGWGVYEESRKAGAIVATAHEHLYSRTHLMSHFEKTEVASTSNTLVIREDESGTHADEGRSFAFVSGLGGKNIRAQKRNDHWWASIYSSSQNARSGALFGVFNYNGNEREAHFYFKDIGGRIPDQFTVQSEVGVDSSCTE